MSFEQGGIFPEDVQNFAFYHILLAAQLSKSQLARSELAGENSYETRQNRR